MEPGYLEPDAVWCEPGGEPVGPLKNGGAFGGKIVSEIIAGETLGAVARRLADQHGRPMRVLLSREDVVRYTPKRPPMALAVRADGSGVLWVARTPGGRDLVQHIAPTWEYHEVDVPGLPTSLSLRAALWAEIAVMRSSVDGNGDLNPADHDLDSRRITGHSDHVFYTDYVQAPNGAQAWAGVHDRDLYVRVRCGSVLDATVLRSYCIGAAHMAVGWVRSEGIAVDDLGRPLDLTLRSFGILRAVDTPSIHVEIVDEPACDPVNGSDAVFAAVAAAVWRQAGFPPAWPCDRASGASTS